MIIAGPLQVIIVIGATAVSVPVLSVSYSDRVEVAELDRWQEALRRMREVARAERYELVREERRPRASRASAPCSAPDPRRRPAWPAALKAFT